MQVFFSGVAPFLAANSLGLAADAPFCIGPRPADQEFHRLTMRFRGVGFRPPGLLTKNVYVMLTLGMRDKPFNFAVGGSPGPIDFDDANSIRLGGFQTGTDPVSGLSIGQFELGYLNVLNYSLEMGVLCPQQPMYLVGIVYTTQGQIVNLNEGGLGFAASVEMRRRSQNDWSVDGAYNGRNDV